MVYTDTFRQDKYIKDNGKMIYGMGKVNTN